MRTTTRLLLLATTAVVALTVTPARADMLDFHRAIRAEALHSLPAGATETAVCVVDTGVNATAELADALLARASTYAGTVDDVAATSDPSTGHGTYVAELVAARDGNGGNVGVWPAAKVVSVRVFPEGGSGSPTLEYLQAFDRCRMHPAVKVVNLSLGGTSASPQERAELEARIASLHQRDGISVVAAAGNFAGPVEWPASAPGVIAVGACSADGQNVAPWSAGATGVPIAAPGGAGVSLFDRAGTLMTKQGTSYSAPQVAATLAALRAHRPDLTRQQAEDLLLSSTTATGCGRLLDAGGALRAAGVLTDGQIAAAAAAKAPAPGTAKDPAPPAAPVPDATPQMTPAPEIPRPRFRVKTLGGGRIAIRLLNRPAGARAFVEIGARQLERRSSPVVLRVGRWSRVTVTYIAADGRSSVPTTVRNRAKPKERSRRR